MVVLVVVLLLVLAACGVLVGSVLTNHPQWAWFSVLLSVLGAALLVVERARRRREASSSATESTAANGGEGPAEPHSADSVAAQDPTEAETTDAGTTDAAADATTESLGDPVGPQRAAVSSEPGEEPGEEDTDAADWLVVSELDAEVVVLDERPRYHLRSCGWLGERTVIRLPVREARELGFTPCALCVPDATLARRARAAR